MSDIDEGAGRRFAALARTVTAEDRQRLTPPADLWGAIADAAGEPSASGDSAPMSASAAAAALKVVPDPTDDLASRGDEQAAGSPHVADVVPLRRRMSTVVLSAAAAVVLVLGVVALVVTGDDEPSGDLVATGAFEPLADGFAGDVELLDVDGRLQLDVEVDALPTTSEAYYELWLIKDLETGEMQSLGPIDSSGRVPLPAGLDPTLYATVDISVEPLDGVPTHSGQSVLRGTLDI